CLHYYNTPLIF
nr:immunoglobulin light chain junction region [Macaca mulatta]